MKQKHLQPKSRYIGFVAVSVDGRISLFSKKPPHWTSKQDWRFFQKAISRFDAVVVGRNTYQSAVKRLRKRNTFVLSSRTQTITRRGTVTFVNPANVNLAKLFQGYKNIAVLGGGAVYSLMLKSRLLDEIFVTIEPLIFGCGKEMFVGGIQTTQLHLLSVKQLNQTGTLLLHYKINYPKL